MRDDNKCVSSSALFIYCDISKISYTVFVFNVSEMTFSELTLLLLLKVRPDSFAEWYAFGICFMRTAEVDRGVHSFKGLSFFIQWPSFRLILLVLCWTLTSAQLARLLYLLYKVVNRWHRWLLLYKSRIVLIVNLIIFRRKLNWENLYSCQIYRLIKK